MKNQTPSGTGDDVKQAEEFVVSAALLGGTDTDYVFELVNVEDFYYHSHQIILRAVADLQAKGHCVSLSTVFIKLQQEGTIDDIAGPAGIAEFVIPTAAGVEYYARIVRDAALRRSLRYSLHQSLQIVDNSSSSPADTLAEIEEKLFAIGERRTAEGPVKLDKAIRDLSNRLNELPKENESHYIRTGFQAFDNLIGGLRPGRVYIVAARPGVGKSAFALKIALNASQAGHGSLFFSLEMPISEIAERTMAIKSSVPLNRIIGNEQLHKLEYESLAEVDGTGGIWIDDRPTLAMPKLASVTRRAIRTNKIRIVFLDYLQLLKSAERRRDRHLEVAEDTKALKELARQCEVAIVVTCQLNRESKADEKPLLSQLRESGSIEQDADCVLLMWRQNGDQYGTEQTICFEVAKQRNGPLGTFELRFVRPNVRYENRS